MELEVGHRIKVIIEDAPERKDRKIDGATVLELRENGDHLVRCDDYLGTSNDGENTQSEIRPLSHFAGRELEAE